MFKQAARESVFIICAAVVLGFSYTFIAGKGFFGNDRSSSPSISGHPGRGPTAINLQEAKALFDSNGAIFVDARHFFDYRRGHIKSALNIPLSEFDSRQKNVKDLPRNKVIVVYCDGSECNSSIELAAKLYEHGFDGVRIFFGGWQEWVADKLPTESNP